MNIFILYIFINTRNKIDSGLTFFFLTYGFQFAGNLIGIPSIWTRIKTRVHYLQNNRKSYFQCFFGIYNSCLSFIQRRYFHPTIMLSAFMDKVSLITLCVFKSGGSMIETIFITEKNDNSFHSCVFIAISASLLHSNEVLPYLMNGL